jgi:hypothetical protein
VFEKRMANEQSYKGSCHCGKVTYEVKADLGQPVYSCNCSICSKKGHLLTFVAPEQFRLLSGEDALSDYQFNHHIIHHLFCRSCGVQPFSRGKNREGSPMMAVNVRCLEGVEPGQLKVTNVDGRSL